ncbi:MAG TPA: 30S ribosomal protein S17 [Elusimicrobiota bacterium]|nr:30S ribosomal protein S17 [Elusimicrobiota bacterium]HMU95769.1 30S ribosomal protein S17 [Elusimicrobiota bacterium]HMX42668.1 30S ribosomal protein S17 [Elusimicrobiota bacterium]HMX93733.1 30S ribosomal protein S17 [Elusimicrobiota bacterium]HMZ25809.1 30S ribosomal protein S17 [Elusimicrobiota bacterium]
MTTKVERADRKTLEGVVLSDKMNKTRVVEVERRLRHALYGKVLIRTSKVYAHDENNESKAGDRISVMATRALSKQKRWRLVKILERAGVAQGVDASLGGKS